MPVNADRLSPKLIEERQELALAVMMSKHLRLGVECLLSWLPTELVQNIVALLHHDDITCTLYLDDEKVKEFMFHRCSVNEFERYGGWKYFVTSMDRNRPITIIFTGGIHGLQAPYKEGGVTDDKPEHLSKIPNPDKNGPHVLDGIKHKAHICAHDDRMSIYLDDPEIPGYTLIMVVLVANKDE